MARANNLSRYLQMGFGVAVILGMTAALASCEAGSYFDPNTKQMYNDKAGRLEASWEDLRVYEFTPQTLPNTQCVFVAGEKKGGLYCTQKESKQ